MDEIIRQAIEKAKEQLPVEIDLKWYQGVIKLDEVKQYIRANINSASRSFVAIGYYLKYIRDNQLYKQDGYETIWELAKAEFGIGKSSASQFMSINDKFSRDGNSPILLEQYREFTSSKLAEMLTMKDEQLEQVTPATTIVEIRQIKNPEKEETVLTSEQKLESEIYATSHKEPEPPKPSYLKCAAYDFYKFGKGCSGCFYDKAENNCPYDRTEYFADIKRQDEHLVRCEVLMEMCDSICKNRSAILEKNNYSTEAIKSVSRGDLDFSFGFGDDGSGHSKYDAEYKTKSNRYHVKEFDGSGKWIFEAGEVDQQIWNFNGNQWRRDHLSGQPETVNDVDETVDNNPDIVDEHLLSETDELILDCYNEEDGWHEEIVSVEHDQVETVQADIIQTVVDEKPSDPRLIPLKMKHHGDCYTCPTCGAVLVAEYYTKQIYWKFCAYCGQALVLTDAKTSNPDRPVPMQSMIITKINEEIDKIKASDNGEGSDHVKWVVTTLEWVKELINQKKGA